MTWAKILDSFIKKKFNMGKYSSYKETACARIRGAWRVLCGGVWY